MNLFSGLFEDQNNFYTIRSFASIAGRTREMSLRKQPDEATVEELLAVVADEPYSPLIRLRLATKYAQLEYPDLASGEAYMALLLCDEIYDEDSEFHDQAFEAVKNDMSPDIETNVLDVSKLSLAEDESNHISDWVKVEIEHWV